jgi:hypothetical protein
MPVDGGAVGKPSAIRVVGNRALGFENRNRAYFGYASVRV